MDSSHNDRRKSSKGNNELGPAVSKKNVDVEDIDLKCSTTQLQLDDAEIFLQNHGIPHSQLRDLLADEDALKKLRRKVDWSLMPLLCGTYLLQYIDKQALSYSAVFDLLTDTNMSSDQYSWMASIFYFAYLIAEWPASYLAQRLPTGKIVSGFVLSWGTILVCTSACQSFAGLAVCRFLLGVFEAVITPAFMLIVSQWYTREEAPSRAGLFYCFNGVGSMVGGILFYGVGQAQGWNIWRIIYVLCGGLTIIWGVVLYFFLPDNIMAAKFFTVEQRAMLIARSSRNQTGVFSSRIKTEQIKEVFVDPQVWLLFWFTLLNEVINGGIANFSKLIVKGFTKSALMTTVYGIPYGACTAIFMFTGPYLAGRIKNFRTIVMILWLIPTLIAVILFWQLPRTNQGGLLGGYYLVSSLQFPASRCFDMSNTENPVCLFRWIFDRRASDASIQLGWLHQAHDGNSLRLPCLLHWKYCWTSRISRI